MKAHMWTGSGTDTGLSAGTTGASQEGPYVDGQHHGRWVLRCDDGQVQEGSVVEGKMHGGWVPHDKDGNQEILTFKNGERVG